MTSSAFFGFNLATDFPFASRLASGTGPADLTFTYATVPALEAFDPALRPAFASQARGPSGDPLFAVYLLGASDLLRCSGAVDFYVAADRIVCHASGNPSPTLVENLLLGTVLAYWLERQGIAALHASAVVVGGRAVAFLSTNHGGKSALAATFLKAGFPLLTDDILPVALAQSRLVPVAAAPSDLVPVAAARSDLVARPGYPTMRMWPDEAAWFLGPYEHLATVHPTVDKRRVPVGPPGFGSFCNAGRPLAAIYLPQRRLSGKPSDEVEIRPVPPGQAVIELTRHAFTPRLIAALGWGPQRVALMARLAEQVPVRHLAYPSGFERLPLVRAAVLDDLDARL